MERTIRPRVLAVPLWILLAGAIPAFAKADKVTARSSARSSTTSASSRERPSRPRTSRRTPRARARRMSRAISAWCRSSPGRYMLKVEMDGFRPVTIAEFSLLGGEIRPLGRITLTAGGVTESVTITAEVTPVQTANSALSRNITGDTLVWCR